jgi:hypothetical protein
MPELILSDITVMGPGYCVIGLEQISPAAFRSVRPMPPWGFAWREPFDHRRGDCVRFRGIPARMTQPHVPHVEDQPSQGLLGTGRSLDEEALVECLRKAEVSTNLQELFGCTVELSSRGGRCEYDNLRFRLFPDADGFALRAEVNLSSGERVTSIPIVDREWRRFVSQVLERVRRSDKLPFAERFLNKLVRERLLLGGYRWARIGLPRPRQDQQCWLMLDSLFSQPRESWLEAL